MNRQWPVVPLEELCDRITVGHVGPMADEYVAEGIPFLRSQNILPFRITTDNLKFIPPSFHSRLRKSALRPGDVAVIRTGYPGTAAVIPEWLGEANCADLVVITPGRDLDAFFLTAVFNSTWGVASVAGRLVGSAQQHFNIGAARRLELQVPPLSTQLKIAAILSAYDDLIENNSRRIKLLEEMAQRIYHEWFVDFRYPGHETVQLVDSELGLIPRGWRAGTLGDLVDVNANTIRKVEASEQIRYIDIASVNQGVVQEPRKMLLGQAPGRARRRTADGDIIWSTVRPNLRSYALLLSPGTDCVASTGFAVLSPRRTSFAYVYAMTTSDDFVEYLTGHATGSAYPAVTPPVFQKAPVIVPPADVLQAFANIAEPLMRLASTLGFQVKKLSDTRNLLLPRLISGQLDVADLDIAMPGVAA